jgi:2,3-bisphosphoglycerate-dependent phosphoglycerate mutase
MALKAGEIRFLEKTQLLTEARGNMPANNSQYVFTFLRHGKSTGNMEGRLQGQSEYPLSELGFRQARQLAAYWRNQYQTFDQIIASPLERARQTAEILAAALEVPIETDPIWMERFFGTWEGLTPEEVRQTHSDFDFSDLTQRPGQNGESLLELYARASQALQSLLNRPAGEYLIVSHGAMLQMTFYTILGLSPLLNFQRLRFQFENTAFSNLCYDPRRQLWLVTGINQTPHLTADHTEPADTSEPGTRASTA